MLFSSSSLACLQLPIYICNATILRLQRPSLSPNQSLPAAPAPAFITLNLSIHDQLSHSTSLEVFSVIPKFCVCQDLSNDSLERATVLLFVVRYGSPMLYLILGVSLVTLTNKTGDKPQKHSSSQICICNAYVILRNSYNLLIPFGVSSSVCAATGQYCDAKGQVLLI